VKTVTSRQFFWDEILLQRNKEAQKVGS